MGTVEGRILKQCGPIESRLEDLGGSFVNAEMPPTGLVMAERDDALMLRIWHTSADDLISTMFKKVRVIPVKVFSFGQKSQLVLLGPIRRGLSRDKKIDYISKPWERRELEELFIRK
jgi:hypothetical protein